ncbi:chlorohydrolase [Streptococcus pneumoniae]|uniref:Chlorohydrolase n=1 Tax=Streptococcus pneumoniae TaxID=1313 RepID=A0A4L1JR53_STREE|nr:hypothetical protein [Streptococcus pneumoniae]MCM0189377.1 hypothetical protein [Streptococcus pneumoniae]MDS5103355.1 hypothetical protein [Streptococcus pneumoniae]MDS8214348.1 hypothetical protein [Streptococcus pneumoniae]CZC57444.1 chlorohydrolase [Streptococcus pneumoniae]CZC82811.1 chlorohydrolase [Streptococcus pneumoniae]
MKIKEQTRKLAVGYSKHCFEVVDRTDEVSSKHCFEVVDRTDEVSNHTHGKATLTWFEEIFEEYKHFTEILSGSLGWQMTFPVKNGKIRKNNLRIEEKRCKKRFW